MPEKNAVPEVGERGIIYGMEHEIVAVDGDAVTFATPDYQHGHPDHHRITLKREWLVALPDEFEETWTSHGRLLSQNQKPLWRKAVGAKDGPEAGKQVEAWVVLKALGKLTPQTTRDTFYLGAAGREKYDRAMAQWKRDQEVVKAREEAAA